MPIYEYRCKSCGVQFALNAKVGDPEPTSAPVCAGSGCEIQKLFGRINTIVAGATKAPLVPAKPEPAPESAVPHVCSKYCEHHN